MGLVYSVVYNCLFGNILTVVSEKFTSYLLASCVDLMVSCMPFK